MKSRLGRAGRAVWRAVPLGVLALWLLGVTVRLTVRDGLPGALAYFFYALPPPVLALFSLMAVGAWAVRRAWRPLALAGVLFVLSAAWTYRTTWRHHVPVPSPPPTCRALFWNLDHGAHGWDNLAAAIQRWNPELIGLVESTLDVSVVGRPRLEIFNERQQRAAEMEAFWRDKLPDYACFVSPPGITLLSRRPLERVERGILAGEVTTAYGHYVRGEIELDGQTVQLIVLDINNRMGYSRRAPLEAFAALLLAHADEPVLVLGDFNTPADSVLFDGVRPRYGHAFEQAGNGYGATWPLPLPVLDIDHVWFSAGVDVRRCALGWSGLSDHRSVVVDFRVAQ